MYREKKILESSDVLEKFTNDSSLVFVSGVFDILHLGHVNFLRKAKEVVKNEVNGKLLVTIHSDGIVGKIKGPGRPYMNLEERLELLSELICVDYVATWYGWESIADFVKELRPGYFAVTEKSYEHTKKGQWMSQSWDEIANEINTKLVKIPIQGEYSSSNYIHLF